MQILPRLMAGLVVLGLTAGCAPAPPVGKHQSDSCKATPPTRLVKAADGNLFPEIGSESFFMRDGGLPWVAGRPHKAVWFFAGADDVRDLTITARLQQASDPALLLVQERVDVTETAEPTGITLPSSGCWELEANLGGDRLIIVVQATHPRADSSR